jgi:hypothetical protein
LVSSFVSLASSASEVVRLSAVAGRYTGVPTVNHARYRWKARGGSREWPADLDRTTCRGIVGPLACTLLRLLRQPLQQRIRATALNRCGRIRHIRTAGADSQQVAPSPLERRVRRAGGIASGMRGHRCRELLPQRMAKRLPEKRRRSRFKLICEQEPGPDRLCLDRPGPGRRPDEPGRRECPDGML